MVLHTESTRWAGKLETVVKGLGGLIMIALVLVTFADVIGRKAGYPLGFAFEFTQVAVGLMFYMVLPLVTLRGEHIMVDLLPLPRNRMMSLAVRMGARIVCAGIFAVAAVQLWQQGQTLERFHTVMMFTRWPLPPFIYCMSVFAAVTALVFVYLGVLEYAPARKKHGNAEGA